LYFFSGAPPEAFLGVEAWDEALSIAAAGIVTDRAGSGTAVFTSVSMAQVELALVPRRAMD
jgi:hypothetical protein